jgi:hypothetical protein
MRELDDALGLSDVAAVVLCGSRRDMNTLHRLDGLFRQSVFGRVAEYEDVNDATLLSLYPVMCQVICGRAVDAQAASATQMGRFETKTLAMPKNREALANMNGQWIDRFHDRKGAPKYIVLEHRQLGQPDPWRLGRCRMEWASRLYLLPPDLFVQTVSPNYSVRPDGAFHQWRKDPPRE